MSRRTRTNRVLAILISVLVGVLSNATAQGQATAGQSSQPAASAEKGPKSLPPRPTLDNSDPASVARFAVWSALNGDDQILLSLVGIFDSNGFFVTADENTEMLIHQIAFPPDIIPDLSLADVVHLTANGVRNSLSDTVVRKVFAEVVDIHGDWALVRVGYVDSETIRRSLFSGKPVTTPSEVWHPKVSSDFFQMYRMDNAWKINTHIQVDRSSVNVALAFMFGLYTRPTIGRPTCSLTNGQTLYRSLSPQHRSEFATLHK